MSTQELTETVVSARVEFPWWLVMLQGIAALLLGLLLVTNPGTTLLTLTLFLGVFWFITGVIGIFGIFVNHTNWGWRLFTGILGILAGLVIIRNPLWASIVLPTTVVWLLAGIGIVIGVANFIRAFMGGGWGAALLGAISLILGFILLTRPLESLSFLIYFLGFWAIISGIAAIVGSLLMLRSPRRELAGPA